MTKLKRLVALSIILGIAAVAAPYAMAAPAPVGASAATPAPALGQPMRLAQQSRPQRAAPLSPNAATPAPDQPVDPVAKDAIGTIATLQGTATVMRGGVEKTLNVNDHILKGDILQTSTDGTLGVTFDDETTFNLSNNTRVGVDEFNYQKGGKNNSALFNVARGSVAVAASEIARSGDMKVATPTAVMAVRNASCLIEVPEQTAGAEAAEAAVKLYQDNKGRTGKVEVYAPGQNGERLAVLTKPATGYTVRQAAPLVFTAVALSLTARQISADRGFVRQAFASQVFGRRFILQRRVMLFGPSGIAGGILPAVVPGLPIIGGQRRRGGSGGGPLGLGIFR